VTQDLWLAVTTGKPSLALPAFFPLAAYQQVKAIYDPAADWHGRLWYDFTLDVGAAHRLVDPDARLVRVIVPVSDAAWVDPGVCANSLGYWHVSGARVVYREHGQERSFGVDGEPARFVLADLLARRLVRGPPRRGAAQRGDRDRRPARGRPRRPRSRRRLLSGSTAQNRADGVRVRR
jgi:hypothetical protein